MKIPQITIGDAGVFKCLPVKGLGLCYVGHINHMVLL
jgi:hypothetical protein